MKGERAGFLSEPCALALLLGGLPTLVALIGVGSMIQFMTPPKPGDHLCGTGPGMVALCGLIAMPFATVLSAVGGSVGGSLRDFLRSLLGAASGLFGALTLFAAASILDAHRTSIVLWFAGPLIVALGAAYGRKYQGPPDLSDGPR
jgi:hypothetical protein